MVAFSNKFNYLFAYVKKILYLCTRKLQRMLVHQENNMVSDPAFQEILQGVIDIIEQSRQRVAVYVNQELTMMHWNVGKFVLEKINYQEKAEYGQKIVATLSQQLTERYGKGFTEIGRASCRERVSVAV